MSNSNRQERLKSLSYASKQRMDYALSKDNGLSGNGMIPHDLWRRIIPIAKEYDKRAANMAQLYSYLIAYVNGNPDNDRYMCAFPSVKTINEDTGLGVNSIPLLSDMLVAVGLLVTTYDYVDVRKKKLYYPQYYTELTDGQIRQRLANLLDVD